MAKKQTTKKDEQFQTVIVKADITATSNKTSEDFKQEVSTKTVYIQVEDPKKIQELIDFGLTYYTPEDEEAKGYFIIKSTPKVKMYTSRTVFFEKEFTTTILDEKGKEVTNLNLKSEGDIYLSIVKVAGGKGKNDFFRLNAILLGVGGKLVEVLPENPFEDLIDELGDDLPF